MANHSTKDVAEKKPLGSEYWWNPKIRLHTLNTLRIPFIRDGLIEDGLALANKEKPLENLSILDTHCGGGILSEPLARLGAKTVGLDARTDAINVAKKHAALDSTLTSLTYWNERLDEYYEKHRERYDVVIVSEAMEHSLNPVTFLIQSAECLKPGGSIFITSINQTVASYIFGIYVYERMLGIFPKDSHVHGHFLSPARVKELLEKQNCTVKAIRGMKYNMFSGTIEWCDSTSIFYAVHAVKNK